MSRFNLLIFILLCSTVLTFTAYSFFQLEQTLTVLAETATATDVPLSLPPLLETSVVNESLPLLFTGDILIARHVEYLMKTKGSDYPFLNIYAVFASSSHVISNFESSIPKTHVKTPSQNMVFSTDATYIPLLRSVGVTHVSLANNHATDYGEAGYAHSRETLTAAQIVSFGHPRTLATSSITYLEQNGYRIGLLAIHTLFTAPEKTLLRSLIDHMSKESDIQIAYIHWGTEYELTHSLAQRALAESLADFGIDAIVGHHPHVTQDIELVKGIPVFYSLGNLIFDQYFSVDVQQGYLLALAIEDEIAQFTLLPVTSIGTLSQPRLMNPSEKNVFLSNLASRSAVELRDSIKQGNVIIERSLATSTKNSIISP